MKIMIDDADLTVMLRDLYERAHKVEPDGLAGFIAEVKEKLPGYPPCDDKETRSSQEEMMRRYVNEMHAAALIGLAAICSLVQGTPEYAISTNQAGVIMHILSKAWWSEDDYASKVR